MKDGDESDKAREQDKAAKKRRKTQASAAGVAPLTAEQVWRTSTIGGLEFETTADLEVFDGVIEQERAARAMELGLAIDKKTYNIFVSGSSGTGRRTLVKRLVEEAAAERPVPSDWVYVNDFDTLDRPRSLELPPGMGSRFKKDVQNLITELRETVPTAFHSKEHHEKMQRLLSASMREESKAFADLTRAAAEVGFEVRSTKTGLVTIPVVEGEAISNKDFDLLPEEVRDTIEEHRTALEPSISLFLERARQIQLETQEEIETLQVEAGEAVVSPALAELGETWGDDEKVAEWLGTLEADIVDDLARFMPDEDDEMDLRLKQLMGRYAVNVVVDNSKQRGAPVIFENHPNYFNLFGKVEKRVEQGVHQTDVSMIRAGSVAKANGGYLVLHTQDLFNDPLVWEQLKAVVRRGQVAIEDVVERMTYVATAGLRPEPIPVQLKIVLLGAPSHYEALFYGDDDFRKYFQVRADFDSEINRDDATEYEVARFVATTCKNQDLRAVDREGVAALVEEASRMVADQARLTLRFNEIANLVVEADYFARKSRSKLIKQRHIERAIEARRDRNGLIREKLIEAMTEDQIIIQTKGEAVGQVNGLAVFSASGDNFGKPLRITARTYAGKPSIINVEREARLSGRIHNKGVLILGGWLGAKYAQDGPLSLTVNLTVEQSYAHIDGDSASAAELIAIISSLSGVPIRQDLALTGSVNQLGEIQSVGGVTEKVEGFFELCEARRLSGKQGVIVPIQNVRHLTLRANLRKALAKGRFHLFPAASIDQALELLTGMDPQEIHRRASAKLVRFRELARRQRPRALPALPPAMLDPADLEEVAADA